MYLTSQYQSKSCYLSTNVIGYHIHSNHYSSTLSKTHIPTYNMTATILFLFLSVVATEKIPIPYDIIRDLKGIVPVKIFTAKELKDYGGSDPTKPIYLALKGVVFDVSTRREFYGKNAAYNRLVGRDSTNAVAKMSLHATDVSKAHDISDLSEIQLKDLEEIFHKVYLAKYPIVGFMDYLLSVEEFANQIKPQDEL